MQKGFAHVLIIILVAVAIAGGYLIYSQQIKPNPKFCAQIITPAKNPQTGECKEFSTPCNVPAGWSKVESCQTTKSTPAPTSSPESTNSAETANWKTYTNTKLGFSFKYPPEASVTESKPGEIHVRYTEQCFACQVNPGYGVSFEIKNLNSKDLREVVEEEAGVPKENGGWGMGILDVSEVKMGDYSGYTYSIKSKTETKRIYLSPTTDDTYIQISYGSQYEDSRGYQQKIDQIISTFKFQ